MKTYLVIGLVLGAIGFVGLDWAKGDMNVTDGYVQDKTYHASYTTRTNGSSTHHPERFIVRACGRSIDTKQNQYDGLKLGQAITCYYRVGKWTGINYGYEGVNPK